MHPAARPAWFVALTLLLAACDAVPPDGRTLSGNAAACAPELPVVPHAYSDDDAPIPYHFLASTAGTVQFRDNTPPDNRITNAGATLGRVLFYDARLSANGRLSCASCHRQEFGLEEVIEFYDAGVKTGPDLDPRLRGPDGDARRLRLAPREARALVAFLESLTDTTFLADVRFSSPFPPGC